jgi:hypothetical protein
MIKWFVYIVLLLILMPCLSSAKNRGDRSYDPLKKHEIRFYSSKEMFVDTILTKKQKQELEEKKKIKEIPKAKRLLKPEKIDETPGAQAKVKPKRQRRPVGLERPPEIPRRNGN